MKVTWQADDIKPGVAVSRSGTDGIIVFQHVQEGPRYCVYTTHNHTATAPATKDGLAQYLNDYGYQPSVLLTL